MMVIMEGKEKYYGGPSSVLTYIHLECCQSDTISSQMGSN